MRTLCLTRFVTASALAFTLALLLVPAARAQPAAGDVHQVEAPPVKPTGKMITLSDFGAEDLAYLAIPVTAPTLGIVLVPDAFGLDDFTKNKADWLAAQGYLVVAVDIYNGHQSTDPGELANYVANLDNASIMKTLTAGVRLFHESPKFKVDHVVAIGWGAGANYVFQAARETKGLDGAITFYGPIEADPATVHKYNVPLCAFYADDDPTLTHESIQNFQQAMKEAGNDFSAWYIEAFPGWAHPKSRNYNPVEDKEAWKVALPFIARIGALPAKPDDDSIIDKTTDSIKNIFQ